MKLLLVLFIMLTANSACFCQDVITVESGHSLIDVLDTAMPSESIRFDSLRRISAYGRAMHVATYQYDPYKGTTDIIAHLLVPIGRNQYRRTVIDTFRMSGNLPELQAVFTANADADVQSELIVLCSWHIQINDFDGYLYETSIYKAELNRSLPLRLNRQHYDTPLIPDEAQANRQGERLRARYNTEARIRRRLKELGFK